MTDSHEELTPSAIEWRISRLDALRAEAVQLTDRIATLGGNQTADLDAFVDRMLPDLESETLDRLRTDAPTFVSANVADVFRRAAEVETPLWATLTFSGASHRKEALARDYDLLRAQLKAAAAAPGGEIGGAQHIAASAREAVAAQQRLAAIPPVDRIDAEILRLEGEYLRLTGKPFRRGEDKTTTDDRRPDDRGDGGSDNDSWLDGLFGGRSRSDTPTRTSGSRVDDDFRTSGTIPADGGRGFVTGAVIGATLATGSSPAQAEADASATADTDRGDLS